jgi:hypothetical protein
VTEPASNLERPHVPDHDLVRCVGQGSYGAVWLARNVMGTFRAVKVVFRSTFGSERPYEREFSGVQKFEPISRSHPGLVSILHVGRNTDSGYFYCVMEAADDLVSGRQIDPAKYAPRTLSSETRKHSRLPLAECLQIGVSLASALTYLHQRGLVHRDIKPSNIIFVEGVPKFADVGLVTDIGQKATFVGTEGYIPPEGPGAPGADLYSLGKVLYEIALGQTPDQFPELPSRLRELDEAPGLMQLNEVILKACAPRPEKRFQSAEEMRSALAALQSEQRTGSRSTSVRPASKATAERKTLSVVILAPSDAPNDVALAQFLGDALAAAGLEVFVDDQLELSVEWARQLERQIRAADAVVALLSATSVRKESLAYAVERAQAALRERPRPALLPVHIHSTEPLPRQLSVAFSSAAHLSWQGPEDNEKLRQMVIQAVPRLEPEAARGGAT